MNDDDNLYDDYDYDEDSGAVSEPPKPGRNRTFVVSLGIVAFIFILSLVALAVVAAIILPQQRVKRENQQAVIYAQNTATAYAATQQALKLILPQLLNSPTPQPPAAKPEQPTNTSVVLAFTSTPQPLALGGGMDSRTATVAALLTQAAASGVTAAPAATYPVLVATALPNTGFADDIRLPLLIGAAILLVVVIILARRLRTSRAK
jgi:LPXTG-motif cell wall-anchored protein